KGGGGRAPRGVEKRETTQGNRVRRGDPSPARPAGPRAAHAHERANAEGQDPRRDGQKEGRGGTGAGDGARGARRSRAEKGRSLGHGRRAEADTAEEGRQEARAARGPDGHRAYPGDL